MAERRRESGRDRDRDRERERRRQERDSNLALAAAVGPEDLTEVRYQLNVIKEAATKSIRDKEEELRRLEEENAELKQMLAEQAAQSSVGDRRIRVDGLNQRLHTVKAELEGIEDERQKLRFQLDNALNEKQELEERLRKATDVSNSLDSELKNSKGDAGALEKKLRDLQVEVATPLPARGESATATRLYMNLGQVKQDQERMRAQLREAKDDCERKKSQLKDLHRRLKRAREILGRRDQQLRDAQVKSANALDYALNHNRGQPDSVSRLHDAMAVVDSKDAQISILTEKANDTDRLIDELLDFVKAFGPRGGYPEQYSSGTIDAGAYRQDPVYASAPAPGPVYAAPAAAYPPAPVTTTYYAAAPAPVVYAAPASSPAPVAYAQPASPYRQATSYAPAPPYGGEQRWQSKADALAQDLDNFKNKVKGHMQQPASRPY